MLDVEDVWFNSGDFRLRGGIFIPSVAAERRLPGLIYCSGFPGNDKTSSKITKALSGEGYIVLWFNYKGIRDSEGELDFVSQVDDLKAAIDYLKSREEVSDVIAVIGHCYGGRVAIRVAAEDQRVKAIAVWDTIGDVRGQVETLSFRITWKLYVALWARNVRGVERMYDKVKEAAIKLNPIDYVGRISPRPLLIIHRRKDIMVSVENAYELERHASHPKELIIAEGRMHTDTDSFFSAVERKNGAIRLTLNWLDKNLQEKEGIHARN